jgi:hypothetical protein
MLTTNRFLPIIILLVILILSGCSSPKKLAVKPNEHMEVGWTPRSVFQSPSYAAWFDTSYAKYQPDEQSITQLKSMNMDSIRLTVIYGMWCSDSRREMPRFFKVLDGINYPAAHLTLIAVDRTMQIPPGVKEQYVITNVPTFIITYRGMEIHRIIEQPATSLEADLVNWLMPLPLR